MIEKTVLDYLDTRLDVPVWMEVPTPWPSSYVLIQKTGSSGSNRLRRATFAVQSIAPSLYEAALLNERVQSVMRGLTELVNIFRCDCESDYEFSNPQTKERRYQAVYNIYYEEE